MELSQNIYNWIFVIGALINIVALICFFIMTANISSIKKHLVTQKNHPDYYLEEYYKWKNAGYRDKAATALHNLFWLRTRTNQMKLPANYEWDELSFDQNVKLCQKLFDDIKEPVPVSRQTSK